MNHILVVDDDLSMREFLSLMLDKEGYQVSMAVDGSDAVKQAAKTYFDLVITDIRMKRLDGIDVLKQVKALHQETIVILISAYASAETAVVAMNEGAFDFFPKPFQIEELKGVVKRALAHRTLEAERAKLSENIADGCHLGSLVGQSVPMAKVYDLIRRAARTQANILITGESGTGKELVAKAIHDNSDRKDEKFVTINCGGMPEQLIESELFGHRKGAFTGASMDKEGLFDVASKGTIFLDEVGELSMPMQVKLLRVVQEKSYRRVGGTTERKVDVRLLAATNKDLETEIIENRFREDLYYRLNVIPIHLPPLRERQGDLPLLAHFFLEKYSIEMDKNMWKISSYAMDILSQYDFPGNVRELENIIQRSVALERSNIVLPDSLVLGSFRRKRDRYSGQPAEDRSSAAGSEDSSLDNKLAWFEKTLLLRALCQAEGVRQDAADLLKTTPRTLRYRLVKFGLDELRPAGLNDKCAELEQQAAEKLPDMDIPDLTDKGADLDICLAEAEKYLINQALDETGGSKSEAAEILGINLRSFRYRLSKTEAAEE